MKFRKSAAAIAAVAAAAFSMSVASSAKITLDGELKDANGLDIVDATPNTWMPIAYNDGTFINDTYDKTKAIIDCGVDWTKAASVEVQLHVVEGDEQKWIESDNNIAGAIIVSCKSLTDKSHNWPQKEFGGVNDEELGFAATEGKDLVANKVSDYTYKIVCPIDDTNCVNPGSQLVQISYSDYSNTVRWVCAIEFMTVRDADGNALVTWMGAAPRADYTGDPAPAAPITYSASAAGGGKGSPDTGIENVAIAAGLAIVAAGAFAVAKKRK